MLDRQTLNARCGKVFSFRQAFTLAEVLITLGIIGVVAVMTIPTLVNNTQKQETIAGLQKAYSIINQAFLNAQLELGSSTDWLTPTDAGKGAYDTWWWDEYFVPYAKLSVIKTCEFSGCWAPSSFWLDNSAFANGSTYKLVLKDGMIFALEVVTTSFARIYVDINGYKSPNMVGKDIFVIDLQYKAGKVVFEGHGTSRITLLSNPNSYCSTAAGSQKGMYCGALIMKDGWQIKDDYPWN